GFEAAMQWDSPRDPIPLNQRITHVAATTRISPNFLRMRLEGDFTAFLTPDAGLHFRLLFGPEGAEWPTLDHRGVTHWPGGPGAWHKPVYTVRAIAEAGDWIDLDIALQSRGRVTAWSQTVAPGTEIAVTGPNGSALPRASWLGLIGDETAMPLICRILEAAPEGTRGKAVLFLRDPDDAKIASQPSGISLRFAKMHEEDPVEAIADLDPPETDCYVFFAAERTQAGRARALFKERGFPAKACTAASYWTQPNQDD
ncbi:MAG: siderophore-interacting protein, partial [Pseudomonadota bacterium]